LSKLIAFKPSRLYSRGIASPKQPKYIKLRLIGQTREKDYGAKESNLRIYSEDNNASMPPILLDIQRVEEIPQK
jgi:hypothetical protein